MILSEKRYRQRKVKISLEYGKKVWLLKNKKGKIIESFSNKKNAEDFKKKYFEELTLYRLQSLNS